MTAVTLITAPMVTCLAEMQIQTRGLNKMIDWLKEYRPVCLPEESGCWALFPHKEEQDGISHNELLVELAGRKCYNSFGLKAGKRSNAEYIANTQGGDVPHASILYHAKMTFFIANVSRRVSHELIRNYVGADRDEEGSPSQESTRYTEHPGHFIVPPRLINDGPVSVENFRRAMQAAYNQYLAYVEGGLGRLGPKPDTIERKRVLEAAAGFLPGQAATSWIWTTNPMALAKLFKERAHKDADAEFFRLAVMWKELCLQTWPNLFPQPWMKTA
jgi:thymidylate synthase (FAD)